MMDRDAFSVRQKRVPQQSRRVRSLALLSYVLGSAGVIVSVARPLPDTFIARLGLALLCIGLFVASQMLYFPFVRWARQARQWQLPGVQRSATRSVVCIGFLLTLLPDLASRAFLPWEGVATVLLVCCFLVIVALLECTMPRNRQQWSLPGRGALVGGVLIQPWFWDLVHAHSSAFLTCMTGINLLALGLAAWLWRRMRTTEDWDPAYRPIRHSHRTRMPWARWNALLGALSRWLHAAWLSDLRARPDMQRLGPRFPQRSLRMMLGGFLLPQASSSMHAQRLPFALVMLMLMLGAGWSIHASRHMDLLHTMALTTLLMACVVCSLLTLAGNHRLVQMYSRPNAELTLLTLLPGLPVRDGSRYWIWRAVSGPPLRFLAIEAASCLLASGSLNASLWILVISLFAGNATAMLALPLIIHGPGRGAGRVYALSSLVFLVLVAATVFDVAVTSTAAPALTDSRWEIASAWWLLVLVMAWFGWRGWRHWQRLPHPFLVGV